MELKRIVRAVTVIGLCSVVVLTSITLTPAQNPRPLRSARPASQPSSTPGAAKYKRKYNTIAHRILDLESEAVTVDESMYQLLDTLIDEAKAKIKVPSLATDHEGRERQVRTILLTIDDILIRHNFIYPRDRKEDWILLLS